MDKIRNWKSLNEFFNVLNKNVEYVVLRNYEEFIEGEFNVSHPDIDILCRDSRELIMIAESTTRTSNSKDLIHQQIMIDEKIVALDVRHVGDGYYDDLWEENMLKKRVVINDFCYVLDEENYFYSLLYHALVQKRFVSGDYQLRLTKMAEKLNIKRTYSPVSIETLQSYMREKNYLFTYPEYLGGITNFEHVDKDMIKKDIFRTIRKCIYLLKNKIKIII